MIATKIKDVVWKTDAALYHLSPPLMGNEHVIVSAVRTALAHETFIFASDPKGEALTMTDLAGSQTGVYSHLKVLNDLGYTVVGGP